MGAKGFIGKAADRKQLIRRIKKNKLLLVMLIPGLVYFVLFCYVPMYGVLMAFQNYKLKLGIWGSEFVGLEHFKRLFSDPYFFTVLKNTLVISLLKLVFSFPAPILFALLLNELRAKKFKKLVQTVSYLPNFISWVVLSGIFISLFSLDGAVNYIIRLFGAEPRIFFADGPSFIVLLIVTEIYKSFGWGAIIYLASMSSIDTEQYESASIDGAGRFKKAFYITLPGLVPVITIQLVFSVSNILNAGFDQIFNMYNPSVLQVSDIIDTWVYRVGMVDRNYSLSTALGLFKSVVAVILVLAANKFAAVINQEEYTLW